LSVPNAQQLRMNLVGTARGLAPRVWPLLAAALGCLIVAANASSPKMQQTSVMIGLTFTALILLIRSIAAWADWRDRKFSQELLVFVGNDVTPCFTTDEFGEIIFQNAAAQKRFQVQPNATLNAALHDHFANPASVLFRLQSHALTGGAGREDVVTRRGHIRLSVHRVSPTRFLWRLEEFIDRSGAERGAENLSLPMLVSNKSGVILFSNEAMRRLLGSRPKRLDRVFNTEGLNTGEIVEVAAAEGPVRAILAEISGAGERREIYLLPVPEQEQQDDMLADFEHVPVALIKFRADGTMRAANRAARDLVGFQQNENMAIHELFEGLGRPVSDWMADVLSERVPGGSEVLRLNRSENDVFLQVSLRRNVEQGRPGILAVLQDATALKTLEAQFVQSQKMQAIGQLAGGIAHDFNNLLTAISGHCDLLLLRHSQADSEYADLVQIHQNANRAASLVGQLLAFSRKQTMKPELVDVQDVLSDMTHLLNRLVGERLQLKLAFEGDLGSIRADKRQLEQVLMNLVVNARDAMAEGGTILIVTKPVTITEDLHRDRAVVPAGQYSLIQVEDGGCGIPPERLQKVFEPFFTTKGVGKGTGLGLSTVYGIVKQTGGFIFVDSKVGEGSVFSLYFPVHAAVPEEVQAAEVEPVRLSTRPGEGVVLLVEDEAPVRAFASRALRLRGYTVLEAENAEEALKTLEDSTLEVDVFVTDVVMPGMDGPSWVRQALCERPNVKVVFVSGYSEECVSENQARIPNSVFLPKPFSLTDLAAVVQGQIHQ